MPAQSEATKTAKDQPTGPWNASLAKLREWAPAWADQCFGLTTNPWTNGILPLKTIELICIAVTPRARSSTRMERAATSVLRWTQVRLAEKS